ncbi:MAG: ABC transporter ATP-binding protein [Candidatus Cloacimonetes bacterium]|nr:ABC transporter ATP-binding protein [Candidatus Cloacimonadota bacterium]MCK9332039.1 ABC transporter ATP-binding protein [Candidatus Cloacimonadota bacterium]
MFLNEIIRIEDLVKRYGDKPALNGLNLSVHEGEIFGYLGPNGAGKTTTVRVISTLTNYDSGKVIVDGHDIDKEPYEAKECMGVIQQQISLDKDLTIRENMIVHCMYHMMGKKEREERIAELSKYVGLEDYLDRTVDSLSGGWKKRAAIICSVLHSPKVLFLDEPTAGLDIQARRLLWDLVRALNKRGTTIFVTTHYIEEAEILCDRVGIIDHGKLIAVGRPQELCETVGSTVVEYTREDETTEYKCFKNRNEADEFAKGLGSYENLLVRKTNLEDVFVELTGKAAGAFQ